MKMKKLAFHVFVFMLLGKSLSFAQIQTPQKNPTFQNFSTVSPSKSYSSTPGNNTTAKKSNTYGSALQTKNAENTTYASPDNIYNTLNKNNFLLTSSSSIPNKSYASIEAVHAVLNDVKQIEPSINYHFPSLQSKLGYNNFESAFNELSNMLEGKTPLDLKRATFITENAYFGNQMNYQDFSTSIKEMAMIVRLKMKEKNLSIKDNDAILYMAHQYFTDTLNVKLPIQEKAITTYPKQYDFDDPFGYDKPSNVFVTKLMAENTGQCKSLPLLFLILVKELGGKAYLSFSPSHSFVKCKDKNGVWFNIELINGMLISDSWIAGSEYVKAEAIRNSIFLDTLNEKQIIAQCLVDLAQYYSWRYGTYDDFALKCLNKAIEYHSNNIWAIQEKSDYYTMLFKYVSEQLHYSSVEQLKHNPKAWELFMQRNRMYALIDGLGYQPMPETAYTDWLKTLKEKQQEQKHQQQYFQFSKIIH